ncbi:MAG: L-rhamnose mutarotase [Anaerolineae bacterium]|nr:L-rhamnose mutarotase [Anaerolineae bacterium]
MQRIGFMMHILPGTEQEYERRHDEIWQEMLDLMRQAGVCNYSIFRHGTTLFNYLECPDWDEAVAIMGATTVRQRWVEYMNDLIVPVDDQTETSPWMQVFFFDGK